MSDDELRIYSRALGEQVFKSCGNICLVGRIMSYSSKGQRLSLLTNEDSNTLVDVIVPDVQNEKEMQKGKVIEVRGFGTDNKKMTCRGYTIFEGDIDLKTFYETVKLVNEEFRGLFNE